VSTVHSLTESFVHYIGNVSVKAVLGNGNAKFVIVHDGRKNINLPEIWRVGVQNGSNRGIITNFQAQTKTKTENEHPALPPFQREIWELTAGGEEQKR
jgi:hypothetical protein